MSVKAIEVQGAQAMQSSLKSAAKHVEGMETINREVAATVAAAVRAPRRTGRLAAAVQPAATNTEAAVEVDVPYAAVIEYGYAPHNIRAQNFVSTAFDRTEAQREDMYAKWLQGIADEVKGA